jgi:hypothetical protein
LAVSARRTKAQHSHQSVLHSMQFWASWRILICLSHRTIGKYRLPMFESWINWFQCWFQISVDGGRYFDWTHVPREISQLIYSLFCPMLKFINHPECIFIVVWSRSAARQLMGLNYSETRLVTRL